jgi:hypothetical protein
LTDHIETFIVNYTGPENGTRECDNLGSIAFSLPPGSYVFTVRGIDASGIEIARSNDVPVTTGTGQPTAIFLGPVPDVRIGGATPTENPGQPPVPAIVPGYFEWDITLPNQAHLVEFTYGLLKEGSLPSNAPAAETITAASRLTGPDAKSGPLASGSYWVTITLGDDWDIYRGSAHVYAGLTTTMTLEAADFHEIDLPGGTEVELEIVSGMNFLALSAEGSVLSADPAVFETPVWYIYKHEIMTEAQGWGGNGFRLDLDAAAAALNLAVGAAYTVTFYGKVKGGGNAPGFWISQSEQFTPLPAIYYVNAAIGNDTNNGKEAARAFRTLDKALSMPFAGDARDIRVTGNFPMSGPLAIDSQGKTTIIISDDPQNKSTITRTDGQNESVITVTGGGHVIFKDVTIDGKNTGNAGVYNRGLLVTGAGTKVTLDAGTTVTGKTDGALTTANGGGGIRINDGATLVMKGDSVVQYSSAPMYGGGVSVYAGAFTMEGDSAVKNNTLAGGWGGGVHVDSASSFIMKENATVTENGAGGNGGGVYTLGTFTMSGSPVISLNTSGGMGGGVYQNGGTFTMTGGTIYGSDEPSMANISEPGGGAAYQNQVSGNGASEFANVVENTISK